MKKRHHQVIARFVPVAGILVVLGIMMVLIFAGLSGNERVVSMILVSVSLFLIIQAVFTLRWMLFAWSGNKAVGAPKNYDAPKTTFTAIVPVRNEEEVIGHTIGSICGMDYPEHLHEVLIITSEQDHKTIAAVRKAIEQGKHANAKLVLFTGPHISKPYALNYAMRFAKHEMIVIFDAEDEPHPDVYNAVNTVKLRTDADVIQSGVQLMNFKSTWFSALNVLEYYFWFKSALHFYSRFGVVPLAGNTVFFSKNILIAHGGWDEACLTEDAEIGIRLSCAGAKIRIIYDPRLVTREETPPTIGSFMRQRTRWNQGFLQTMRKGDWLALPRTRQKLLAGYILGWPIIQALLLLYIPVVFFVTMRLELSLLVAIISLLPLYLLISQLVIYTIGLYEFLKDYGIPYRFSYAPLIMLTFVPYLLVLSFSAYRAYYREIVGVRLWEKTEHLNAHRVNDDA